MAIHEWFWFTDEYNGHWFELEVNEMYTTPPTGVPGTGQYGTSVIEYSLAHYKDDSIELPGARIAPTVLVINDQYVYSTQSVTTPATPGFPAHAGYSFTGTMAIDHNADGNKQIFISLSTNIHFTEPRMYVSTYIPLTYIPPIDAPEPTPFFELFSEAKDGHKFRFYGTEEIDILGNHSIIHWTLSHIMGSSSTPGPMTVSPITLKIDGEEVYKTNAVSPATSTSFPSTLGSVSGDLMVPHEKNGRKSVTFYMLVAFAGTSDPDPGIYGKSVTLELTPIDTNVNLVDTSLDTPPVSGHYLSLKFSESSDLARNGSWISWALYSTFTNPDYQRHYYYTVYAEIGTAEDNVTRVYELLESPKSYSGFPNTSGVTSGSIFIPHNAAGDANLYVKLHIYGTGFWSSDGFDMVYTDTLSNTDARPPSVTATVENTSPTQATFILSADSDISVNEYCKVEAKYWNPRGSWSVGDYCVYYESSPTTAALYKCISVPILSRPWDPTKWEMVNMEDVADWTTEGLSYLDLGGHEVRAGVSAGLIGDTSYAIIFKVTKLRTGVEGQTEAPIVFVTDHYTILHGVNGNVKLDGSSSTLSFKWSVTRINYTYSIDIYSQAIGQPEALLGTITGITQPTAVTEGTKEVTLDSAIRNNAYLYLTRTTELPMYMVLHTYADGREQYMPQKASFVGYLTEADSKPVFDTTPTFSHVELNAKVTALINSIPEFSVEDNYSTNDLVIKGDKIYKANTNVSAGSWDSSEWDEQDPYQSDTFIKSASTCRLELSSRANPQSSNPNIPVEVHYEAGVGETIQEAELVEETTIVRSDFTSFGTTGEQLAYLDAVDSRGYRTKKNRTVTVLNYSKPKINTLTAYRNNQRLGELLIMDGEGTQFAIRDNHIGWENNTTDKGTVVNNFIVSLTNIPQADTGDIPGGYTLYEHAHSGAPEDQLKQEIKEVCEYYNESDVTYVTEVLLDYPSIETAYKMLRGHYGGSEIEWNQLYSDAKIYGVNSNEVTADLYSLSITDASSIATVKRIVTGTYNVNRIIKAEVRYAKEGQNYSNNWVDVTSHITQTDTTFTLTCHEDARIQLDSEDSYKLQFRVYDKLTPDSKPVSFELKGIPPGAPLMSFQKKRIGVNKRSPQAALDVLGFDETVENVTTHIQAYAVDGYPIYDHVIFDQTDNNNVHVRLWSSGRMEVECTKTVTLQNALTRNNPVSIATFASISYPAEYLDSPQLYFSVIDKNSSKPGQVIGMKGDTTYIKTKMGEVYLLYFGSTGRQANEQFYVTVRAVGMIPQSSIDSIIGRV